MADGRIPPQAIASEQEVLGAIMQNAESLNTVIEKLAPVHFYVPKHRLIFKAIRGIVRKGRAVDIVTVSEELKDQGKLAEIGGRTYLSNLTDGVVSFSGIESHCDLICRAAGKNQIINSCSETIARAYDPTAEFEDVLSFAEKGLKRAADLKGNELPIRTGKDMAETLLYGMDKAKEKGLSGISTGYEFLDKLILGLQPSYFIIVAARPSIGKTAFAMNLIRNICIDKGNPALFISLEMSELSLVQRFAMMMRGVSSYSYRRGTLTDSECTQVTEVSGILNSAPIYLADMAIATLPEICQLVRQAVKRYGIKALFIDYLQLIRHHGETRNQAVGEISAAMKGLAREHNIPNVVLSQLSRKAENKIPQLDELRDSGCLEQDPDQVIFLHRAKDKSGQLESEGVAIVAKARNEKTGNLRFVFDSERNTFGFMERNEDQAQAPKEKKPKPKPTSDEGEELRF